MDNGQMHEKILEHGFRIDATERLAEQHNIEMRTLANAITDMRKDLNSAVNKMLFAIIAVAFLGDSAGPMILKLIGV